MKTIFVLLILLAVNASAIEQSQIDSYGFGVSLNSNSDGSGGLFEFSSKKLSSFEHDGQTTFYRIYAGFGFMTLPNAFTSSTGKLTSAGVGLGHLGLMMTTHNPKYNWLGSVKIGMVSINPSSEISSTGKTGLEVELGNEWITSDTADFFGHKGVSTFLVKVSIHPAVISDKNAAERAYLAGYTMGIGFRYYF